MRATADAPPRSLVVCEHGNRWTTALRRFHDELMPRPATLSISRVEAADVAKMLAGPPYGLLWWEVAPADFVRCCDHVTQAHLAMPAALQLAAGAGLSPQQKMVLSELGVAATLRHPEQLPSLRPIFHGHFAPAS